MVASYLELYEEGEVEHINAPTHTCILELLKGRVMGSIVGFYSALEVRKAVNLAVRDGKLAIHH